MNDSASHYALLSIAEVCNFDASRLAAWSQRAQSLGSGAGYYVAEEIASGRIDRKLLLERFQSEPATLDQSVDSVFGLSRQWRHLGVSMRTTLLQLIADSELQARHAIRVCPDLDRKYLGKPLPPREFVVALRAKFELAANPLGEPGWKQWVIQEPRLRPLGIEPVFSASSRKVSFWFQMPNEGSSASFNLFHCFGTWHIHAFDQLEESNHRDVVGEFEKCYRDAVEWIAGNPR